MVLPETSKAAVVQSPRELDVVEFDVPDVGPTDGLLEVEMVGVCATDPKIYNGEVDYAMPVIPGHEIVGRVAALGDEAAGIHGVDVGDRVVVYPSISCGRCEACRVGKPAFCDEGDGYGTLVSSDRPPHLWGGYAEYMYLVPGATVVPVSDEPSPEAAILVSAVLGNGIRWTHLGDVDLLGTPILVQGPGPQGLAATIAADAAGASPIVVTGTAEDERRLAMAERLGADVTVDVSATDAPAAAIVDAFGGEEPPVVVDVTGSEAGMRTSLAAVAHEGTAVLAGLLGSGETMAVTHDDLLYRDVRVHRPFTHRVADTRKGVEMVERDEYPFDDLVTHVYPLAEAETALKVTGREVSVPTEPIKVAIDPRA